MSSAGGTPSELTSLNHERAEVSHRLPHVLPGGDAVLFTVSRSRFPRWDEAQIWVHSRRTGVSKQLIDGGADARYVATGHLLYVREGELLAVPFDAGAPRSDGRANRRRVRRHAGRLPRRPAERHRGHAGERLGDRDARLHHRRHAPADRIWRPAARSRRSRRNRCRFLANEFRTMRVSPDGTSLALATVGRDRGIVLYSFTRGTVGRLTAAGRSHAPDLDA